MRIVLLDDTETPRPTTVALLGAWERAGHDARQLDCRRLPAAAPAGALVQYRLNSAAHFAHAQPGRLARFLHDSRLSDPVGAVVACRDKLHGQRLLEFAGLPVPAWMSVDSVRGDAHAVAQLGPPPWVVKPARGSQGAAVELVGDLAGARAHRAAHGPCVLQCRVEVAMNLRVLCSAREVLSVYERRGEPGALVHAVSTGAARVALTDLALHARAAALGRAMCAACDGHVLGCDVLVGADGRLWALEANTNPGFDDGDDGLADAFVAAVLRAS